MKIKSILVVLIFTALHLQAQIESSSLILNRGKLWQTLSYGKVGPSFSNWTKRGIGLDWPGFDPSLIAENIGGAPSHMVSGGLYVGAKWMKDSILSVEDWSLYAGSIAEGAAAKYRITKHHFLYGNGGNYWLKEDPNAGEQVIETVWEYNSEYNDEFQVKRMLPVRVKRLSHQWSGSKDHENYIIHEYTIKNISPELRAKLPSDRFVADTLYDFYALINYGLHSNSRAWSVLFPSLTDGARNTWFNYHPGRRLVYGFAADYPETPASNENFGIAQSMGPIINGQPTGEYLAPAYVGFSLLYSSPDLTGSKSRINQQGWSAASNSIDLSGPFTNLGSLEAQYAALKDIRLTSQFVSGWTDTLFMKKSRMWSLMSVGPYNILPGDSVVIVIAEIVNGIDYDRAINPDQNPSNIVNRDSRSLFFDSADKAQFTFDNNYNHPDPPAAPEFVVDYNRESDEVANVIKWNADAEKIPDPDDGQFDLSGYIIYRSNYLPVGPWTAIDTVKTGDAVYFSGNEYKYIDRSVDIGQTYYYAITSFDTGKDRWTGEQTMNNIPSLESSIFANRTSVPFVATIAPAVSLDDVLVVPNPFVIGEGFSQPGVRDKIQFVNLPNPCKIRIYTVRGDIVKTIEVPEGSGAIAGWDQLTDFGQFVESGIYIFHVESPLGEKIGKLAIVR